jgi:putative two-component system hydrogenase maturation factor HypX/HoxX
MGTELCRALNQEFVNASNKNTKALVIMGAEDFFSNGIDLNIIESSASPEQEAWLNINAIDDLVESILTSRKIIISAI